MVGTAWDWRRTVHSYQLLSAVTVTGTGENCVSRTRKSLWGKGISSRNCTVSGKEKSVMAEAGIMREGDTGGRDLDISGYMNTVQPQFNNFSGHMYDAFPSVWYLDSVHLKKGLADDCIQTFQVFISLNFVHMLFGPTKLW